MVSYGNWAGPGNRAVTENQDYVNQQRALNPAYDEASDPKLMNDPRYAPIDGMDAAAKRHDGGYSHDLGSSSMFGWEGMRNVREDDRRLVADTQAEMDTNGDKYSDSAKTYSEGLRGFFGSRVMGQDAADWAGAKAGEAGQGIGSFVEGAKSWSSLDEAGGGIAHGLEGAGSWLAGTGEQAWTGVSGAANTIEGLGVPGALGAVGGFGDVAAAGVGEVAGDAWTGAKSAGTSVAEGAQSVFGWLTDGI
jgi:hypothetical protein